MAISIDTVIQVITQTAIVVTKAVAQAIMAERGDETTKHRSEEAGVR